MRPWKATILMTPFGRHGAMVACRAACCLQCSHATTREAEQLAAELDRLAEEDFEPA